MRTWWRSTPRMVAGQMVLGTDGDDGTSIRLGQGLGAAVAHLDAAQTAMPSVPLLVYPSILVNQYGQRFINEDTYCGRSGQAAVFHQQARCSLVLDEEIFESVPEADRWGYRPTWVCADRRGAGSRDGAAARSLQSTVDALQRSRRPRRRPALPQADRVPPTAPSPPSGPSPSTVCPTRCSPWAAW
jgi:3-oxo-5alpha-steroid 4-dehydrogenase